MGAVSAGLRAALGERVREHEPVDVDGVAVRATLEPATGEELAEALAAMARDGLAAVVRGGGSHRGRANQLRRADVLLSTAGLAGVEELDAEDGVVRVRGGTPLASLRETLRASGGPARTERSAAPAGAWELPLDPPGERATVGGTLAAGACGPRRTGFGPPRDCVLGLDVALASGERTRCGGRVVKNVTGYDLAKLYVGSWGSLGVIEAAWLRLRPTPDRVETRVAVLPDAESCWPRALAAARRGTARVATLVRGPAAARVEPALPAGDGWLLVLELAGDAAAVERDAREIEAGLDAAAASGGCVERLRAAEASAPAEGAAASGDEAGAAAAEVRLRVRVVASALAAARRRLEQAPGLRVVRVHPRAGWVVAEGPASALDAAWEAAREAAAAGRGHFAADRLPAPARGGRDAFGDPGAALPLMRALKQRFDPEGVLNPGLFAGRL